MSESPPPVPDQSPASAPPPFPGLEQAEVQPPLESRLPEKGKFPCGQCGANLEFSPTATVLECPYCGFTEPIPQSEEEIAELDYHEYLEKHSHQENITGLRNEVRCETCGATILVETTTHMDFCVYCATPLRNDPVAARELIAPKSLLPFKITPKEARKRFQEWIQTRWFAPSDLIRMANAGRIDGIYVPHWTYDSMTVTQYSGMRGDDYWVTETDWTTNAKGERVQQTKQVRKTRWTAVGGRVDHWFDDVLVVATSSLPPDYVRALEPWDLANLVPFDLAYLTGFRAERYQIGLDKGFAAAREIMDQKIRQLCCQDIGGDHQTLNSVSTKHLGITFKHLLLPIWHTAYHYRGTLYRIVVNARNGQVRGERPISWWKVTGFSLAMVALAGTIAAVVAYFQQ